jgi:cytochrome c-type biogenesis protein
VNLVDAGIAAGAGALSITSPCCLPLLPGYLSYLTGLSTNELTARRQRAVFAAMLFVLGFTIVFAALGATASVIGDALLRNRFFGRVTGVFIALMGLAILFSGRIGFLSRGGDFSRHLTGGSLWTAAPLGAAFAITYTPCIGPILGAILTLSAASGSLSNGVVLLVIYSLGLGIPFLLLSLSVTRVRGVLGRAPRGVAIARSVSGVILVAMGILLVTDLWLPLMAPLLRWYGQAQWPPV